MVISAENLVYCAELLRTVSRFFSTTIAFSAFRAVMLRAALECTRHVCCGYNTSAWMIVVDYSGSAENCS